MTQRWVTINIIVIFWLNNKNPNKVEKDSILTEVGVFHGLLSSQSLLMIVAQQFIQQIQRFWTHQVLILRLNKVLPALACLPEDVCQFRIKNK